MYLSLFIFERKEHVIKDLITKDFVFKGVLSDNYSKNDWFNCNFSHRLVFNLNFYLIINLFYFKNLYQKFFQNFDFE